MTTQEILEELLKATELLNVVLKNKHFDSAANLIEDRQKLMDLFDSKSYEEKDGFSDLIQKIAELDEKNIPMLRLMQNDVQNELHRIKMEKNQVQRKSTASKKYIQMGDQVSSTFNKTR